VEGNRALVEIDQRPYYYVVPFSPGYSKSLIDSFDLMKPNSIEAGVYNRYETILNSFAGQTDGNACAFAEVSRQTRLEVPYPSIRDAEIISVCAGVAGPVLCSYVLWILDQSIGMGLKRLYFISRDGEVLLEMARRLLPSFWPNAALELRYLHGSRQAWMLPSFTVSKRGITSYLLRFFENSTLKSIFARVDLKLQDCEATLLQYGFTANDWTRELHQRDLKSATTLVMDANIQEVITDRAEQRMDVTLGYLEQQGLFDDIPYGLVDLGWTGSSKEALEKILSARSKQAPPFFLFGHAGRHCPDNPAALHTYHFNIDETNGVSVGAERNMSAISVLIEMFCASFSKGISTYAYRDGRCLPVFRPSIDPMIQAWGFKTMRGSILRFTDLLTEQAPRLKSPAFLSPEISHELLRTFWRTPTRNEAAVWGLFPFEEDPNGSTYHELAPRIGAGTFWRAFLTGNAFRQVSVWSRGVLALNPPWVRFLWLLSMAGYRIRKKIFRRTEQE
jgi:hypothetical protein